MQVDYDQVRLDPVELIDRGARGFDGEQIHQAGVLHQHDQKITAGAIVIDDQNPRTPFRHSKKLASSNPIAIYRGH
jgi:hypothetical protein